MNTTELKSVITLFALFASLTIFAQRPGGRGGMQNRSQGNRPAKNEKPDASKIMSMLDINNDNKIDVDEASKDKRGKIAENFSEIDADSNGFISLEELKASLENRKSKRISAQELIKKADDNKDGKLNELEIAVSKNKMLSDNFKTIDTNKDAELDVEEIKTFLKSKRDAKRKKRN
jgi:Ca2+-binding EF-hand superfamily protein